MIVSYYVNLIVILISYPILSWNLVTQMWNIIVKYPGTLQYTVCRKRRRINSKWFGFKVKGQFQIVLEHKSVVHNDIRSLMLVDTSISTRSLLILWSVGQRSRSRWPWTGMHYSKSYKRITTKVYEWAWVSLQGTRDDFFYKKTGPDIKHGSLIPPYLAGGSIWGTRWSIIGTWSPILDM